MTLDEFKARAKNDLDRAYEAGKAQGGGGNFPDKYQDVIGGNYQYAFCGNGWTDEMFVFNKPFVVTNATAMFRYNRVLTDTKYPMDFSSCNSLSQTYQEARALKVIRPITVTANITYSNAFSYCLELESIRFNGEIGKSISFVDCSLLDAESIDNVFSHLGGSATATLTFSSTAEEIYDAKYGEGAFQAKVDNAPSNWAIGW